ncbi:Acid phosphatase PHO1 [Grifola frondosa]|uniref:Acid phosphatase PHO1 n=1 Tax=Grifola frondosa TaxID=5627 RepID=A0A1C7MNX9_GRIFR|nr:Acid phosphatase PHO1 [Grifola frondosa]
MSTALFTALLLLCVSVHSTPEFNPQHHSGAASPYFNAPSQFGIPIDIPAQCSVDQAAYINIRAVPAASQNQGPLAFLPSWVPPVDDQPHEPLFLPSTGAREAFDLGVKLRKLYGFTKGGENMTQRVVDTATYFAHGYLSQGNYVSAPGENRGTVVTMPDSVNFTFADSLTPSNGCPAYGGGDTSAKANTFRASYQGKIAARLNQFLDGLVLDDSDVGIMQDLCGFQAEISGDTRFCDVFHPSEWEDYEYADDLNYYYGSGPGNPFSATVGFPWVKAVTDLFVLGPNAAPVNSTFVPPSDHELYRVYPLSVTAPDARRHFRSSYLVSFRGYVALEKLSCDRDGPPSVVLGPGRSADAEKFVPVRINNAPVPLSGCTSGPGSSCPLQSFAEYVERQRAAVAGDFVERCGLRGVSNATGVLDIFTEVPSRNAQSSVLAVPLPYAS